MGDLDGWVSCGVQFLVWFPARRFPKVRQHLFIQHCRKQEVAMRMRVWALTAVAVFAIGGRASAAILVVDDFVAPAGTTTTPVNQVYTSGTSQQQSRYLASSGLTGPTGVQGGVREMSAQNNVSAYSSTNLGGIPLNTTNTNAIRYNSIVNSSTSTYSFGNTETRYFPDTATAGSAVSTGYAGRGQGGLQYDGGVNTGTQRQMAKHGSTAAPLGRAIAGSGTLDLTQYKYLVFKNLAVDGSGKTQGTTANPSGTTTRAFQMTVTFNSRTTGNGQYRYTRDLLLSDDAQYFYMPLGLNDTSSYTNELGWNRTSFGGTTALPNRLSLITGIQVWFDNTNSVYGVNSKVSFDQMFFSDKLIPEPSSIALAAFGVIGLAWGARRRKS